MATVYTPETVYGTRLQALLIDEGTPLVRKVFDQEVRRMNPSRSLHWHLMNNKHNLESSLTPDQEKVLNPPAGGAANSSENFDIALLSLLLGIFCHMKPPNTGWSKEPPVGDKSPMACIIRLRLFRNENYAHITSTALSNTKFRKLWKDLSDILRGLGGDQNRILKRKTEPIDPEQAKRYLEKFEKLHKEDNKVKELLVAYHKEVSEKLGNIEKKVDEGNQAVLDGQKAIIDGQKAIITEVKRHSRLSDTEGNQEDNTPIPENPITDEQVADGVGNLSLGVGETAQGNVPVQPSGEDATTQSQSTGTGELDNNSEVDGQNSTKKLYDFGILCTMDDKSWTKTNIVDKLEQQNLQGYLPSRDDIGGDSVFQYLTTGIGKSRNIIVVYSPSTNSDNWFKKGYQTAIVEQLKGKLAGRVIPVLLDGFTSDNLPFELSDITPLYADDSNFFQKLQKSFSV